MLAMVGIYRAFNFDNYPTRQFTDAGSVKSVEPFSILPFRVNLLRNKLAIVAANAGAQATADAFVATMTAWHPPLNGSTIGGTGFANPALRAVYLDGFADCITRFSSEAALEAYVRDANYDTNWERDPVANPKIWGAIVFNFRAASGSVDYSIRLNSTQTPGTGDTVNQLARGYTETYVNQYLESKFYTSGPPFLRESGNPITLMPFPGFLSIQREVDRFFINRNVSTDALNATQLGPVALTQLARAISPQLISALLGEFANATRAAAYTADLVRWFASESYAPQQVDFVPFPVVAYQSNGFYNLVLFILSFILVIVLSLPASRLVRGLVLEKELKLREGMRMMGLSDTAYFLSHVAYGCIFYAILSFLLTVVTATTIFKSSDKVLVFLVFFLFGTATTTFALLVSVFFSKAKTASGLSAILFIAFYFPAFVVNDASYDIVRKRAGALCHGTAFGLGIDLIGQWENSGAGLGLAQSSVVLNNWSVANTLGMLVIDTLLYGFLAFYFDAVLPPPFREFGVARPWYFLFTAGYWREVAGYAAEHHHAAHPTAGGAHAAGPRMAPRSALDVLLGRPAKPVAFAATPARAATDASYFEAPDAHLQAKEREDRCVTVSKLRKEYATPDGLKVAVDDVDLTMYEGQIFVLLGHNGAGKTTIISMLTGLTPPTGGTANVFGSELLDTNALAGIRKQLGVCPQHDVLWPELTVKEHLQIFAAIKDVPADRTAHEIDKAIAEVGLTEKVAYQSSKLSGGQRRKLSVCIALMGGSKVIFLDEPTSGMDPYSRRSTWQILQNAREGRVMVLTTHFMDEADILGDRIAVMSHGGMQCCGSPLFLKNRYGVGYVLTMIKGAKCDERAVLAALRAHVPEAAIATNVGAELSVRLPLAASPAFPAMFQELDEAGGKLGVESYGVSITSIEDVFLKIASGEKLASAAAAAAASTEDAIDAASPTGVEATLNPAATGKDGKGGAAAAAAAAAPDAAAAAPHVAVGSAPVGIEAVRAAARADQSGLGFFVRHFWALLIKRWQYTTRDGRSLLFQLFLPAVLIALGLLLININTGTGEPSYQLSTAQFNADGYKDVNAQAYPNYVPFFAFKAGEGVDAAPVNAFMTAIPVANVSAVPLTLAQATSGAGAFVDSYGFVSAGAAEPTLSYQRMSVYLLNDRLSMAASKYGSVVFVNANRFVSPAATDPTALLSGGNNAVSYSVLFNSTAYHGPAIFANVINSRLYATALGAPSASITTRNFPLPSTNRESTLFQGLLVFTAAIIMVVAFSFVASSIALFVVREREVSAKHQQFISGVSVTAYWLSNFVFDLACYYVPAVLAMILAAAFNISSFIGTDYSRRSAFVLSFILFGPALVSFTYVLSFAFKNPSSASTAILFLGVLTIILISASQFMSQIASTCVAERGLRYVFRLVPTFSWGWNLIQLAFLNTLPLIDATCDGGAAGELAAYDALEMKANGMGLVFLVWESFVYFGVVLVIEFINSKPLLRRRIEALFWREPVVVDAPHAEDDDVVAEAGRVDRQLAAGGLSDSVLVTHLRKVYEGGKVAVRNLSYGIPAGEVFGFLGINGAGKTTTLQMLSGDVLPSSGGAFMGGYDILTQQPQVRRLLGYCPQYEALLEFLSAKEHLQLYARIKGVPEAAVPGVVEAKLREMDLKLYENKLAGSLSGGNKRKLSVAIALIGAPPVVFLDEPSTGVDPVARRFMWKVISRVATERKLCSIILTTHSMEEAEALCTRIGIMVGGRLRCLGSAQHLRNRHGQGYQVEVKMADATPEAVSATAAAVAAAMNVPNTPDALVPPAAVRTIATELGVPDRAAAVSEMGSGWALYAAFARSTAPGNAIPLPLFAEWWANETAARAVYDEITVKKFPGSRLLERNGLTLRFRVVAESKVGALFSALEGTRALGVQAFTLSETSLEQLFIQFSSQQAEETGVSRSQEMGKVIV